MGMEKKAPVFGQACVVCLACLGYLPSILVLGWLGSEDADAKFREYCEDDHRTKQTTWFLYNLTDHLGVVCSKAYVSGECQEGWVDYADSSDPDQQCYRYSGDTVGWQAARDACAGWGAGLATVDSDVENVLVFSLCWGVDTDDERWPRSPIPIDSTKAAAEAANPGWESNDDFHMVPCWLGLTFENGDRAYADQASSYENFPNEYDLSAESGGQEYGVAMGEVCDLEGIKNDIGLFVGLVLFTNTITIAVLLCACGCFGAGLSSQSQCCMITGASTDCCCACCSCLAFLMVLGSVDREGGGAYGSNFIAIVLCLFQMCTLGVVVGMSLKVSGELGRAPTIVPAGYAPGLVQAAPVGQPVIRTVVVGNVVGKSSG